MKVLLRGENIWKSFGGVKALRGVNFQVEKGEIVGLIGPNGSGKTTLFNIISGIHRPDEGTIIFKNNELTNMKPYEICRMGISRTFQLIEIFPRLTVLQNVMVGRIFGKGRIKYKEAQEEVLELLREVGLIDKAYLNVKNLSHIDQKRIEIARALATKPELLLLDEVFAGLTVSETKELMEFIRLINKRGITIFLIEHVMRVIMSISSKVMVFHHGKKIAEGSPKEIVSHKDVLKAYLGGGYAAS